MLTADHRAVASRGGGVEIDFSDALASPIGDVSDASLGNGNADGVARAELRKWIGKIRHADVATVHHLEGDRVHQAERRVAEISHGKKIGAGRHPHPHGLEPGFQAIHHFMPEGIDADQSAERVHIDHGRPHLHRNVANITQVIEIDYADRRIDPRRGINMPAEPRIGHICELAVRSRLRKPRHTSPWQLDGLDQAA